MRLLLLATLAPLLGPADPPPESWPFFRDHRAVSHSGKNYLVIRKRWGKLPTGFNYELCKRREGAALMKAAQEERLEGWPGIKIVDISRDPKDRLLTKGFYPQVPLRVTVLDELGGFVLFEQYAGIGLGKAFVYIDGRGEAQVEVSVENLFDPPPPGFYYRSSRQRWYLDYWVDEVRESILVAASDHRLREISLRDGTITTPGFDSLTRWFKSGPKTNRESAIEVGTRVLDESIGLEAMDLGVMVESSRSLARDEEQPLSIRLRAAMLVLSAGHERDFVPLFQDACARGNLLDDRRYAVRSLPTVMGEDALPFLRGMLGREPNLEVWREWKKAVASFGTKALPMLTEMLSEEGQPSEFRTGAAYALREIGSQEAVPALEDALSRASPDANEYRALEAALKKCSGGRD